MRVLVPNLGSTSLKYQLLDMTDERVLARGKIERIGSDQAKITLSGTGGGTSESTAPIPDHRAAVEILIEQLSRVAEGKHRRAIDAVGFKAVHGGPAYRGTFLITDEVLGAMKDFVPVAPVHNPVYIQAMEIFRSLLPEVPMVAVFEPGFHSTLPPCAAVYGVPYEWSEEYGVRRYGFHGSSHRYVSQRVPKILGRPAKGLRLISCHLGGSSSICAVRDGQSVDTSMGFSPQSGLEQGARSGDLDPFAALYVMEKENLGSQEIRLLLCKQGGLLGISGLSNDLRDLEEAAEKGHERARLALDVFVYEIKKYLGAYAAALGGVDVVCFAGGIGENSWRIREESTRGLEFMGVRLDRAKNRAAAAGDRLISAVDSAVKVMVVYTNEEIVVARETKKLLSEAQATS